MTQPPCAVCRNTEGIQLILQRLFKMTDLVVIGSHFSPHITDKETRRKKIFERFQKITVDISIF